MAGPHLVKLQSLTAVLCLCWQVCWQHSREPGIFMTLMCHLAVLQLPAGCLQHMEQERLPRMPGKQKFASAYTPITWCLAASACLSIVQGQTI